MVRHTMMGVVLAGAIVCVAAWRSQVNLKSQAALVEEGDDSAPDGTQPHQASLQEQHEKDEQAQTATCSSYNGTNAVHNKAGSASSWSKTSTAEQCNELCLSRQCSVWAWHDDSFGAYEHKCVVWSMAEATAKGRISSEHWVPEGGVTSGKCQASNYKVVAKEGHFGWCKGYARYGKDHKFGYWQVRNGQFACSKEDFGLHDPDKKVQECQCNKASKNNTVVAKEGHDGWCKGLVRFGKAHKFTDWQTQNGKFACSNDFFGNDPNKNVPKVCECFKVSEKEFKETTESTERR